MWPPRAPRAGPLLAAAIVCGSAALAAFGTRSELAALGAVDVPRRIWGERLRELLASEAKPVGHLPDGGYRLYQNASFGMRLELDRARQLPLGLVARAHGAGGDFPHVVLRVDGELASAFHVTSSHWSRYEARIQLDAGGHDLEWAYVNDRASFPEPLNLDVHAITLGAVPPRAPERPRWSAPCAIEPERLALRDWAEPDGGAIRMWNNGTVADDVSFPHDGRYLLRMALVGARATGDGRLELRVDDVLVRDLPVEAGAGAPPVWLDLERGTHRLAWRYISGSRAAPAGEDLTVERILIGEPAPGPARSGPLRLSDEHVTLAAGAFELRSAGAPAGEGFTLGSEGFLRQTVTTADDASFRLTVRARGERCAGRGPRLLVLRDADQLALLDVNGPGLRDHVVSVGRLKGRHELSLVHERDTTIPGECNSNVHIESISLDRERRAEER